MQLTQIGVIHSPFQHATGTPIQPFLRGRREGPDRSLRLQVFQAVSVSIASSLANVL